MADGSHILLVDDDDNTRNALTLLLQTQGYQVACASNGQEALSVLSVGRPPQLILLDLMMPVMDGRQLRQVQRQDPRLADIPVVLVSADSGLAETAADLGVAGYLEKPVDMESLLAAVRQHC